MPDQNDGTRSRLALSSSFVMIKCEFSRQGSLPASISLFSVLPVIYGRAQLSAAYSYNPPSMLIAISFFAPVRPVLLLAHPQFSIVCALPIQYFILFSCGVSFLLFGGFVFFVTSSLNHLTITAINVHIDFIYYKWSGFFFTKDIPSLILLQNIRNCSDNASCIVCDLPSQRIIELFLYWETVKAKTYSLIYILRKGVMFLVYLSRRADQRNLVFICVVACVTIWRVNVWPFWRASYI